MTPKAEIDPALLKSRAREARDRAYSERDPAAAVALLQMAMAAERNARRAVADAG